MFIKAPEVMVFLAGADTVPNHALSQGSENVFSVCWSEGLNLRFHAPHGHLGAAQGLDEAFESSRFAWGCEYTLVARDKDIRAEVNSCECRLYLQPALQPIAFDPILGSFIGLNRCPFVPRTLLGQRSLRLFLFASRTF